MEMTLPPDFKEFLKLLNENEVKYLISVDSRIGSRAALICATERRREKP
jgi:hypothetical protein